MCQPMIAKIIAALAFTLVGVVGCSSGGSDTTPSTKTGYFIDSAVEGLEYTSGSTSGTTGADGSFKYEEGKPVTFKLGNLTLGSLTVSNGRVFPVDLVNGAVDETDPNVTLIAQVLQTLDSDGDPSNGITILPSTRQSITATANLATANATDAATTFARDLNSATNGSVSMVTVANARNHLQGNLLNEYLGAWTGNYSGNDSGTCNINIEMSVAAASPTIAGTCTSNQLSAQEGGVGTLTAMRFPSSGAFQGTLSNGAVFTGQFTRKGGMSGTWVNGSNYSGTWGMTKQ